MRISYSLQVLKPQFIAALTQPTNHIKLTKKIQALTKRVSFDSHYVEPVLSSGARAGIVVAVVLTVSGVVAVTVYFAIKKKQGSIIPQVQRTAITEQPLDRP